MTGRFTLHLPLGCPAGLAAALGTVPDWFASTARPEADLVWIAPGEGWADQLAASLHEGARAVVVELPEPPDPDALGDVTESTVLVVTPRSHAPQALALGAALEALEGRPDWVEAIVVDASTTPAGPGALLWQAATLLAATGVVIDSIQTAVAGPGSVAADATAAGVRVRLSGVSRTYATPAATVKAFSGPTSLVARLGDPLVGAPGGTLVVAPGAATITPTRYESPYRVALRQAHDALAADDGALRGAAVVPQRLAGLLARAQWDSVAYQEPTQWKEPD